MSSLQENNEFCSPRTLLVPQGEFVYTFRLNLQLFKKK